MRHGSWQKRQLVLVSVAIAIVGAASLPSALGWLGRARGQHVLLSTVSGQPMRVPQPIVAAQAAFHGSEEAAVADLGATLRDLAVREGALIEQNAPRPAPALGLVARHAVVSGSARTMLRFVEAIETRTPAIRLSRYRLETTPSGRSLRLECDPVMAFAR